MSRSRWKTLILGPLSVLAAHALTLGAAHATPISLSDLTLVGTSDLLNPTTLRLTPNYDTDPQGPSPAGAAWSPNTVNVADPFAVSFTFRMSDPTGHLDNDGGAGDGIAFLIQNDPAGNGALGIGAGGMGFMYIANSVAVMFDTYQNNYAYGDPNGNYVAVNTRGTAANVPHHYCTDNQFTTDPSLPPDLPGVYCDADPLVTLAVVASLMDDGDSHNVDLIYNPGVLGVRLDGVLLFEAPLNLAQTLSLQNGTNAYIGFTAGTRFSYQNQDILALSYTQIPEPATSSAVLGGLVLVAILRARRSRKPLPHAAGELDRKAVI